MNRRIGLALGGGGARGLAHLGVLKVLEDNGIPVNLIAGTSMGSVIGAMYAQFPHAEKLIDRWLTFLSSSDFNSLGTRFIVHQKEQTTSLLAQFVSVVAKGFVINISPYRQALLKTNRLSDAIAQLVDDEDIQDTLIPFTAVASDLNSGHTVAIHSGRIREAITISSSIPGFIAPHARDGQLLVDGGVTAAVPVEIARDMGADFIIAVDVGINSIPPLKEPNILDIITRVDTIRGINLNEQQVRQADICIHPDVKNAHWSEFYRFEEFIQAGITSANKALPEIREKVRVSDNFFHTIFSKFNGRHNA